MRLLCHGHAQSHISVPFDRLWLATLGEALGLSEPCLSTCLIVAVGRKPLEHSRDLIHGRYYFSVSVEGERPSPTLDPLCIALHFLFFYNNDHLMTTLSIYYAYSLSSVSFHWRVNSMKFDLCFGYCNVPIAQNSPGP